MGLRFRKSVKIAPGVRLNISKKSVGISAGVKGYRKSINSSGRVTTSIGVPGTGVSYVKTENLKSKKKRQSAAVFLPLLPPPVPLLPLLLPLLLLLKFRKQLRSQKRSRQRPRQFCRKDQTPALLCSASLLWLVPCSSLLLLMLFFQLLPPCSVSSVCITLYT